IGHPDLMRIGLPDSLNSWTPFEVRYPRHDRLPAPKLHETGWSEDTIEIAVRVDNSIPHLGIPDRDWDGWWNHGGIFRDVYLYSGNWSWQTPVVRTYRRDADTSTEEADSGGWTVLAYLSDQRTTPAGAD